MEYETEAVGGWFPDVKVNNLRFAPDARGRLFSQLPHKDGSAMIFTAGFDGIADFIGRFEYSEIKLRNFSAADCKGNTVVCRKNRALIKVHGDLYADRRQFPRGG